MVPLRRRRAAAERWKPLVHSFAASVAGPSFAALHMTWGAVNECCTQAGYAELGRRTHHPVLSELLRRIMRQEGRHIDVYASEAERRLDGDRRAQRLVRSALRRMWKPVGAGVMPQSEVAFLVANLFGDDDGRITAARIDRRIDRLPGLDGLGIVTAAVDRYSSPALAPAAA